MDKSNKGKILRLLGERAALREILQRIVESEDRLTAQIAIHNSLKARREALADARTLLKEIE